MSKETMEKQFKSPSEIEEEIRQLKQTLQTREQQLEAARKQEYVQYLKNLIERFDIHTTEDLKRIESVLENVESIASQRLRPAKRTDDIKVPVTKSQQDAVRMHALAPKKEPDVPISPKEEPAISEDDESLDWVFSEEIVDSTSVQLDTEVYAQSLSEDIDVMLGKEKATEEPTTGENLKDFWGALEADLGYDDFIAPQKDNTGISVNDVISAKTDDPSLNKFKGRPAIVNAESALVSAIAGAVEEGWVKKKDVIQTFFSAVGDDFESNDYDSAGRACDVLEPIWAAANAGNSEEKLKEFLAYPYHVRCKAIVLAKYDLKHTI